MRKCIRCDSEMVTNLNVKVDAQGYGIKIMKSGVFGATIQKPRADIGRNFQLNTVLEDYHYTPPP